MQAVSQDQVMGTTSQWSTQCLTCSQCDGDRICCQNGCQLPWQYYFTVGSWFIPAVLLPLVVCGLYIVWVMTLRTRFLASVILSDKGLTSFSGREVKKKRSNNDDLAKDDEKQVKDEESQKTTTSKEKTWFEWSREALDGVYRFYFMQFELRSIDDMQHRFNLYVQIVVTLLEGVLFKPELWLATFMITGGWILLLARDTLLDASRIEASTGSVFSVTATTVVLLLAPLRAPADLPDKSGILIISAACVVNRSLYAIGPTTPYDPEEGFDMQRFLLFILGKAAILIATQFIWNGIWIVLSPKNPQTPWTQRFYMLVQAGRKEIPEYAYSILGGFACLALWGSCWVATSYLSSCIGLRRVLFGFPPTAPAMGGVGTLAGLLSSCVASVALVIDARRMDRESANLKLFVFRMIEAVPQTVTGILSVASVLFGISVWIELYGSKQRAWSVFGA